MTNEVLDLIAARLTADEILDIIGFSTFELAHALADEIKEWEEDFMQIINE